MRSWANGDMRKYLGAFVVFFLCTSIAGLCLVYWPNRFERVLGVKLPREISVIELYVEHIPDYPIVEGYAKISLGREEWSAFVSVLQLYTNNAAALPTESLPDTVSSWWTINSASEQYIRASRAGNERSITAVQQGESVFIRFSGNTPLVKWE